MGKNYAEDSYLYFNQEYENIETDANSHSFLSWKSAGKSNEKFDPPESKNNPKIFFDEVWLYLKIESSKFSAPKKNMYTHDKAVNIYIVYLMPGINHAKGSDLMRFGLFGATTYDSEDNLKDYGAAFESQTYTHDGGKESRNLVILGVNSANSNNVVCLGNRSIKVFNTTTIQAKDKIKTNCTITYKKFMLSLHYNDNDSYLSVNSLQLYKFKASDDEIKASKLNLGSISDNTKYHYSHTLNDNIYHFSVDYQPAKTDKIQKIHKYLMKEYNIK